MNSTAVIRRATPHHEPSGAAVSQDGFRSLEHISVAFSAERQRRPYHMYGRVISSVSQFAPARDSAAPIGAAPRGYARSSMAGARWDGGSIPVVAMPLSRAPAVQGREPLAPQRGDAGPDSSHESGAGEDGERS